MANRIINKLKNLNLKLIADPTISKGTAIIEVHDEELEDISNVEPNDMVRADILDKASKVSIATATIEGAYKGVAVVEAANRDGFNAAAEKWKGKVGISDSESSWISVEASMKATHSELLNQTQELKKISLSGGRHRNGGIDDGGEGNVEGSGDLNVDV